MKQQLPATRAGLADRQAQVTHSVAERRLAPARRSDHGDPKMRCEPLRDHLDDGRAAAPVMGLSGLSKLEMTTCLAAVAGAAGAAVT